MIEVVNKHTFVDPGDGVVIYIGRGSPLGNPASHLKNSKAEVLVNTRDESLEYYKNYIDGILDLTQDMLTYEYKRLIRELNRIWYLVKSGKKVYLVCFCSPKKCHGHYIKEVVESQL